MYESKKERQARERGEANRRMNINKRDALIREGVWTADDETTFQAWLCPAPVVVESLERSFNKPSVLVAISTDLNAVDERVRAVREHRMTESEAMNQDF